MSDKTPFVPTEPGYYWARSKAVPPSYGPKPVEVYGNDEDELRAVVLEDEQCYQIDSFEFLGPVAPWSENDG